MSEENVELTLRVTEAFNRRDVEAAVALWDEEGVWYPALEALTEGRREYRGPAEMRQYYRDLAEFADKASSNGPRCVTSVTGCSAWVASR
jgi:ketosteroid isomerase-like protein